MTESIGKKEVLIKKLLDNISKWSQELNLEESMNILDQHNELMSHYQVVSNEGLTNQNKKDLQKLCDEYQELMEKLEGEKAELFEKMAQLNQSEKIAHQYIKQFSESFFIDKDF
ncbi:hypothetical protein [Vagococcus hydrophili]|uniref:Uncharacterized protein n=1 Tax=Vagococcus hydrophili TaxID=2714947 RepID=A0A6G8AWH5_9ENTE|nr:hypothetical protein [Vagococcus hydrophili]QIL49312.1 hypothetical protein G7082_12825 [Vagococcus hydrophili]